MNITFEHIDNARDLGGMTAADGYILKTRKLLRCASLAKASEADLALLSEDRRVRHIIDLRATLEHNAQPDPELAGVSQLHIPLMSANALGVVVKDGNWAEMLRGDWQPDDEDVCGIYRSFVDASTKGKWRNIFHVVLNTGDDALLIHCANGKDRTGVVVAVLLLALGVSREDVMEDYLATNAQLVQRRKEIYDHAALTRSKTTIMDRAGTLLEAKPLYLNTALDYIEDNYDGIEGFLEDVCGLSFAEDERLREIFLQ